MKIGTRITLSTTALVALALGAYGWASVHNRREELYADLERQSRALGSILQVAMEAALKEGLFEDLPRLVSRVQAQAQPAQISVLEIGGDIARNAPLVGARDLGPAGLGRLARLRRVLITGIAQGDLLELDGRPLFAHMVPLRDHTGRISAAIDVTHDAGYIEAAVGRAALRMTLTIVLLVLALGAAVLLVTRRNIGRPIEKLVAGVRDVSAGDLSRVVLQEREDEIGVLAARFNEMTASLREARAETRRGVEARLQLEESLRRSEKLAAIGSLAAGIAHEVGTPLNVIYGRARALERKAGEAAEVQKNATIIAEQAARITKIIQQLLDVARRRTPMRTEVDLGRLARATLDFLEHQLAAHAIRARLSAEAEPTRVVGDPDQLQQVLLNLCLNAIQAMAGQGQGSLAISLSQVTRRKPGLDRAAPVDYAVLTVEDSGNGIAQEHRAHIFEPFYSTKSDGKGTGLGLPVCQSIVEEHDGFIEVDSREGSGSRFRVFLPRPAVDGAENAPDGPPPSASPTTPASATATAAAVPAQAVAAAVPAQAVAAAVPITPAAAVAVPATTALAVSATAVPALPEEEADDHD